MNKISQLLPVGQRGCGVTEWGNVYKYLGVKQIFQTALSETKMRITQTYVKRLWKIWGSELNERYKVNATNVWAVLIFQYLFFSPVVKAGSGHT